MTALRATASPDWPPPERDDMTPEARALRRAFVSIVDAEHRRVNLEASGKAGTPDYRLAEADYWRALRDVRDLLRGAA